MLLKAKPITLIALIARSFYKKNGCLSWIEQDCRGFSGETSKFFLNGEPKNKHLLYLYDEMLTEEYKLVLQNKGIFIYTS